MQQIESAKVLIEFGADPNISQNDGESPLHVSCKKNDPILVELLLKNKANPNAKINILKETPLHYAIKQNVNPIIIFHLIKYGALLSELDNKSKKPIDYINSEEMRQIIDLFLKDDKQAIQDNYYKLVLKTNINVLNKSDKIDNVSFEDFSRPNSEKVKSNKTNKSKTEDKKEKENDIDQDIEQEQEQVNNKVNSTMDLNTNINNTDINLNTISNKNHNDTKYLSFFDFKSENQKTEENVKKHEKKKSDPSMISDINLDLNPVDSENK